MWPTLLTSILPGLIDKIWPDPQKAEEAKLRLLELQQNGELKALEAETQIALAQIRVNEKDAEGNWWQAGWRPWVGWVCGSALAYSAIIEPIARFVAKVGFGYDGAFPVIDTTITLQVLLGMLGFGAMRHIERKDRKA